MTSADVARPSASLPPRTFCAVTDRRRLLERWPHLDAATALVRQAAALVAAGIDLIQIREPDLDARTLATITEQILDRAAGMRTRIVVNDRIDVALATSAHGAHLPSASVPTARVRRIVPAGFLLGRSVHALDEAASEESADYIIAGTVFATPSKPANHQCLGLERLAAICRSSRARVLAIGGIGAANIEAVFGAGAQGIAAIEFFLPEPSNACEDGEERLVQRVRTVRRQFDTS